jgi:hypothetical protein
MLKSSFQSLILLGLIAGIGGNALGADMQRTLDRDAPQVRSVHPMASPVPLRHRPGLILIRDTRAAGSGGGGGGCWTHCYARYDECMGVSEKPICVSRIKTCMETCERLSGMSNPTQR